MAAIGSLRMEILIRVGEGEPVVMGEVTVPLKMSYVKNGTLIVETREVIDYVSESLKAVFGSETTTPTRETNQEETNHA